MSPLLLILIVVLLFGGFGGWGYYGGFGGPAYYGGGLGLVVLIVVLFLLFR
jgi:hypothetical protein